MYYEEKQTHWLLLSLRLEANESDCKATHVFAIFDEQIHTIHTFGETGKNALYLLKGTPPLGLWKIYEYSAAVCV